MNSFKEGYSAFTDSTSASLAASEGDQWVENVNSEIEQLRQNLLSYSTSEKTIDTLSGDLAEHWHADTFNIDAVLNGSGNRACVPRSTDFASPDVVLNSGEQFQIKYYQDGAHSAKAQATSLYEAFKNPSTKSGAANALANGADPNSPVYSDMGRIIPEGQLNDATQELNRKIAKEGILEPKQVDRYADTRDSLSEKIQDKDGISSKGLSREGSKELAKDVKNGDLGLAEHGLTTEDLVKLEHVMKSSLQAGLNAAAIAMALKAAPALIDVIQGFIEDGDIDGDKLIENSKDVASTGAKALVVGTMGAAITECLKAGLLGEALKDASPSVVAAITLIAFDTACNGIKVARGQMSSAELAAAAFKQSYLTAISMASGSLMQSALPIPVAGYILGSLVGSVVGTVSYEAGSTAFVSLCVNNGMTFFGLVEQDYTMPVETLTEMGVDIPELDTFIPNDVELDAFTPALDLQHGVQLDRISMTGLHRGVIAFGKVGYI